MLNGFSQPRRLLLVGILVLGAVLAWSAFQSGTVDAQTATPFSIESVGSQIGLGDADLRTVILNVIRWLLGFVTLVAVAYMIYGGYLWMTAAGNEQRVEKAKQVILQAAIGLVIILLAWAIVLFAARTTSQVTSNGNTDSTTPCIGFGCPQFNPRSFDLTGVTSCAQRPDYDTDVPRSSAVSLTFNHDVDLSTVQAAVEDAIVGNPNLVIEKCEDGAACGTRTTIVKPLDNQVYSGSSPTGAPGNVQSEWVARNNTVTFYHTSFSTDETSPDNLYFEPSTTYRLTVPRDTAVTALRDTSTPGRTLQKCQKNAAGAPIEGDLVFGENCREDGDTLIWTFTTGTDADGPPISVQSTVPSSSYLVGSGSPDRNVARSGIIGVDFTNALDPASVTTGTFQVFKFTAPPDVVTGAGGVTEPTPLPAGDFDVRVNSSGSGAWLQLKSGVLFDPFTWYKVVAKDFRNLCGTTQDPNPFEWVFETNDTVPGVQLVYPPNGATNMCPATEVFVKFSTSMWDISSGSTTCTPGTGGTFVTNGSLTNDAGRIFQVVDEHDPNNPSSTCMKFGWVPADPGDPLSGLLSTGLHTASVSTNLVIDQDGNTLNRNWSFEIGEADQCVQPPYISSVSPGQGGAGACVSVIGNYFEKQLPGQVRENDGQNAGDTLVLGSVDQTEDAWTNRTVVSTVEAGGLAVDQNHDYTVTVNYPAPIGPLESNVSSFFLRGGNGTAGPCLLTVNPDMGQINSNVNLTGKRLGTFAAGSRVEYSSATWGVNPAGWSDAAISNVTVSPSSLVGAGEVWAIRSDGAESNHLSYEVKPITVIPPGDTTPRVDERALCDLPNSIIPSPNPKRNDNEACLNTQVSADFTVDMDIATINGSNIFLQKCDPACTTTVGSTVTPTGLRGFTLVPSVLEAATTYQVTITTGVQSNAIPPVPLAGVYTWRFKTKNSGANCPIANVAINSSVAYGMASTALPTRYVFRDVDYGVSMTANVVDAQCRTLDPTSLSFSWNSSETGTATLTPDDQQTILAHNPSPATPGTSEVTATADGKTSSPVRITYDPVSCTTSADCATNGLGEACPASACVDNRCTPIVNEIDPASGPIGTWTTVKGCWFGGYSSAQSTVTFLGTTDPSDDRAGLVPNTAICGTPAGTWTNERIVREVPDVSTPDPSDDAVTGNIQVKRFDGTTVDGPTYTVNTAVLTPGLCKLNPTTGPVTTALIANGARFGPDEPGNRTAQDQVNVEHLSSGTTEVMSTYASWVDNRIGTAIPAAAQIGGSEVRVVNDGLSSNPWPFTVTTAGADSCAQRCTPGGDQCGAGQGCGADFCCSSRPSIVSTSPANGSTNVCRNLQVDVVFDQTISAEASSVAYTDGGAAVSGNAFVRNDTLSFQPGLVSASAAQVVTLNASKIRSLRGVAADVSGTPIQFQTGADICQLDQVRVRTALNSNSHRFTTVSEVMEYRAEGLSLRNGGTVIVPVTGSYAWTWAWLSGDTGIASLGIWNGLNANPNRQDVQAVSNGSTVAQATATVTEDTAGSSVGRELSGRGEVIVDVCNFPWTFSDSSSNCDSGGACTNFNFTLNYCQGQSAGSLLPNFSYTGSNAALGAIEGLNAADPTRLKSIFFKESATSQDVIGILIFDNPDLLSPFDWFEQRFPLDSGGSSTVIAGYPALRTGTTAYIGVTDLSGGSLQGRMFVVDFNSNNATQETQNIYNQMLNKTTFNTNVSDLNERQQIRNDTKRVQDLASLKLALAQYNTSHGSYPPLQAGSYLVGLSTSAWPSWQQTLGNALGSTAPIDPESNSLKLVCKAPDVSAAENYEPSTCWSESAKKFQCPPDAHIYAYRTANAGTSYSLYAQMEYTGSGSFINAPGASACSGIAGSACNCFNYTVLP